MSQKNHKILVIGSGAIGGISAALMKLKGYDVTLVTKYPETAEEISQKGLHISGIKGEITVKIPAIAQLTELRFVPDFVFHATKAYDMETAAREVLPHLSATSRVISMQNGICEDRLAGIVGAERVISCVVGWGATLHDRTHLEMTSTGEFVIGALDGRRDPALELVREMLSAILPVEININMRGMLYSKLIINSAITSLGVITGLPLGKMLARHSIRSVFIQIMQEAMAVAGQIDLHVEPYAGKLDYYNFLNDSSFYGDLRRHLVIRIIGFKYRRLYSSGLQSLERGRPTEIDFLNGYISETGAAHGIATPVNDLVVTLVKEIEQKVRAITPENIQSIQRGARR